MEKSNDKLEINNLLNKYIEESLEEHKFKFLLMFNGEYNSLKLGDVKASKIKFDGFVDSHYELEYDFILCLKGQNFEGDFEKNTTCHYLSFYKNGEKSIRQLSYEGAFLWKENRKLFIDGDFEDTDPTDEKVMEILKEINFMDFVRAKNIDKDLCSTLK